MNIRTWTNTGNTPENRSKALTFLVCFIFSFTAWLFIKLSGGATTVVPVELHVTNIPGNLLFTHQSDSIFALSVKTTGIKILTSRNLRRTQRLETDFSTLQNLRNEAGNQYFFTAPQAEVRFSLLNEISRPNLKAYPDTIFFAASEAFRKKVPVIVQKELDMRPGFQIYDAPSATPDSVYVSGPVTLQDSIMYITTQELNVKQVDKNIETSLPLILPYPNRQVSLSTQSVDIKIHIEEFTEATVELPLKIDCPRIEALNETNRLLLFPEKVTVFYLVALRDVRAITPDMFEAKVNCPDIDAQGATRLKTRISEYPGLVEIIRLRPPEVEYIWIKNE
ncbi:MAG: YbbR-like domain-containing protein [Bacteroidetes bacterium]|nr:MAG: YbbR-like domain-containing protein [Bacteroidota bacterium]